jgi:hypothetical protein
MGSSVAERARGALFERCSVGLNVHSLSSGPPVLSLRVRCFSAPFSYLLASTTTTDGEDDQGHGD